VTSVLERAAEFFLVPAGGEPAVTAALPPTIRAVVLGAEPDATPLAAALALSCRAAGGRTPPGLVATWQARGREPLDRRTPTRAAARLAACLSAHELEAFPRGRLAWLVLPSEPEDAAAAVRRASAIVAGPVVTAIAGSRPAALEALIAEHDLAIVAAEPATPLARAALTGLAGRGVPAVAHPPLRRGVLRGLALAGLAGPRLARELGVASSRPAHEHRRERA
jgi:hypothetical protein